MHGYAKKGSSAGLYESDNLVSKAENIKCFDIDLEQIASKIDFDVVYSSKLEIKHIWQQIRQKEVKINLLKKD